MDSSSAIRTYQRGSIESAPPIKVLRLMYQAAIRSLDRASTCDPETSPVEFHGFLSRSAQIVGELRCSLRPEHAPELSEELRQLYLFAEREIARAASTNDVDLVRNARSVLAVLQDAWDRVQVEPEAAS